MSRYKKYPMEKGQKINKYKARSLTVDGEYFASQKEFKRWCDLKHLERAGEIMNLERQVKYPFNKLKLKSGRVPSYVADYVYNKVEDYVAGKLVVEDVKSPMTRKLPTYKLKWALMKFFYNIEVVEV